MKKKLPGILSIAILFFYTACHTPKQSIGSTADIVAGSKTLYQFKWNATNLQGQPVTIGNGKMPYLLFKQGQPNKVSGNTGCNNLTGSFTLTESDNIKFSPLATTRMACIENNNEASFIEAIGQANKWSILNNELSLSNGNKVVAKFTGVTVSK